MIDALALGETTPGPLISIGIFVGYLAGQGRGAPWLGATAATFWLFLPSFVFVLAAAPHMDWLTSRAGVKEFLKGVTSGVVGLMFAISIPFEKAGDVLLDHHLFRSERRVPDDEAGFGADDQRHVADAHDP